MSFLKETRKTKKNPLHPRSSFTFCLCQKGKKKKKRKKEIRQSGARKVTAVKSQHAIQIYGGYTDTRCQERTRWHDATVTYTPRPGFIHHPSRDAISAIFTRKASRPIPAARSSNKARYTHGLRACIQLRASRCSRVRGWLYIVSRRCWGWQGIRRNPFTSHLVDLARIESHLSAKRRLESREGGELREGMFASDAVGIWKMWNYGAVGEFIKMYFEICGIENFYNRRE